MRSRNISRNTILNLVRHSEEGIDSGCIELAVRYLKMVNMNIGNYLTQEHRIEKQNKTMSKCELVILSLFIEFLYLALK